MLDLTDGIEVIGVGVGKVAGIVSDGSCARFASPDFKLSPDILLMAESATKGADDSGMCLNPSFRFDTSDCASEIRSLLDG